MSLENNLLNNHYSSDNSANLANRSKKNGGRKKLKFFIFFLILIVGLYFSRSKIKGLIYSYQNKQSGKVAGEEDKSQVLTLDKKFEFPGLDDNGKEKGKIQLKITQVEKTNQVIVQDKTYTSKNDKSFLIVNLELKNESTKRLNIFPGDLIRLVVNGDEGKKFAPDLHNNYVLVAPISTKVDRVGFVIDENFDNLKLQVGGLDEDKEIIKIKFET